MQKIIDYLKRKYNPASIILYGSYSDKTNNLNSDFDALVISLDHEQFHDTSFVDGIELDVFVYPVSYFEGEFNCDDFVQIFDGKIVLDNGNFGKNIRKKVISYIESRPKKSKSEIGADVDWCTKMLGRAKRNDAEGMFRWHWVLIDSLEIFFDVLGEAYFGPKKALKRLNEIDPIGFDLYKQALESFDIISLENWIMYIKSKVTTA